MKPPELVKSRYFIAYMPTDTLLVFVKNPISGQVKTRIARTAGHEKAVAVYQHLLTYTQNLVRAFNKNTVVYYGDFINPDDGWTGFEKRCQTGDDLGQRMHNAFAEQFQAEAGRIVIIGSDCFDITPTHLQRAFSALDGADVVMGPATDGGYYLLGMRELQPFLFENMPWSQPELGQLTEAAIRQRGLTLERLDELTDIDEWADYERYVNR